MSHLAKDATETITRWMPDGSGATSPVEYVRADKVAELQADVSRKQTLLDDAKNVMERQIARRKELEAQVLALQSWQESTIEDLAIGKGKRVQYYDYAKYMRHKDDCKGGGDHCCPCGMSQVWMNIDQLLDSCEALAQSQPQPLGWEQS